MGAGPGTGGLLHDAYFLAEGESKTLAGVFSELEARFGKPRFGGPGKDLGTISDRPVPARVVEALNDPPRALPVRP